MAKGRGEAEPCAGEGALARETVSPSDALYTFCSAHKQLLTSYETLKNSVASLAKEHLTILDLAKIKAVCPELLRLAYVPSDSVQTDTPSKRKRDEDLFVLAKNETPQYTLLVEFTDRTVDTGKATGRGRVRGHYKRTQPSVRAAKEIIVQRNAIFARALDTMVAACLEAVRYDWLKQCTDPLVLLAEAAEQYVPRFPGEQSLDAARTDARKQLEEWALHPETKPPVAQILAELPIQPWWRDQIVPGGRRTFAGRTARYAEADPPLDPALSEGLKQAHGIERLYQHQASAVSAFQRGQHVVVSTGTSSGKSLVYQLPIASALMGAEEATALCIFPTKALTQDQLHSLLRLFGALGMHQEGIIATYDGDTPREARKAIRDAVRVLFTNPDMLHQSILPYEEDWRRFFRGLRIVVIDELHIYSGIFGTHVALVLRRLRRLCAALGNEAVQFVSCSATIANPAAHLASLTALDLDKITVVDQDGSPCGNKLWAVWNAPEIDPGGASKVRASAYNEVSQLFRHLILRGLRTIVFTKVRRTCEIVIRQIREDLARDGYEDLAERVHGYRSGYSAADRRRLEHDMFSGSILGLVATSALELGVDIGSLDAVIIMGVPYSTASMWQQAGRAGRRQHDSLVVLVGESFSVDQYYMRNPELIFAQPHEPLWVDTENELVLTSHIQCAALEVPVCVAQDMRYFGPRLGAICAQALERDQAGYYHYTDTRGVQPAKTISIRGARQETYQYVHAQTGTVLEEVELERVFFEAFPGAVFLHQGLTYVCQDVHHSSRVAVMNRAHVLYHTRPRDLTDIDATETWRVRTVGRDDVLAYYGRITVTSLVWAYDKVDRKANILDTVEVDAAPLVRTTQGIWIDIPWTMVEAIAAYGVNASSAIHAAEHAILSLTPLFVASGSEDVRTECKRQQREITRDRQPTSRKRPSRLIFYDKPGQDAGICAHVFQHVEAIVRIALSVIETCPCADGCPGCIDTLSCLADKTVSSKLGAQAVLRGLLHRPLFDEHEPLQHERGHAEGTLAPTEALTHTLCSPPAVPLRDECVAVEHVVEESQPERPWPQRLQARLGSATP